eukprot:gene4168-3009_t
MPGARPPAATKKWTDMYFYERLQHVVDHTADFLVSKCRWWLPCVAASVGVGFFLLGGPEAPTFAATFAAAVGQPFLSPGSHTNKRCSAVPSQSQSPPLDTASFIPPAEGSRWMALTPCFEHELFAKKMSSSPPMEKAATDLPVASVVDASPPASPAAAHPSPPPEQLVDAFGEAFRRAPWPPWTVALLVAQGLGTVLAVWVLLLSRSWAARPPALDFLRQAQCPLYLAFQANDQSAFTLWLPGCPNISAGNALPCIDDVDCAAVGPLCAAPAVRRGMTCGSDAARPAGKYCRFALHSTPPRLHPPPYCFPPATHCAICRTLDCQNGPIACLIAELTDNGKLAITTTKAVVTPLHFYGVVVPLISSSCQSDHPNNCV